MSGSEDNRCSFCGHSASEAERMLVGPAIAICDDCIVLAAEIAGEGRPDWCDRLISRITEVRDKGK